MPFKSKKQRKYMHAKHPEIAKEWENKYRYGGTIGAGESVAGTSSDGTDNRHVFEEGGVADGDECDHVEWGARRGPIGRPEDPRGFP